MSTAEASFGRGRDPAEVRLEGALAELRDVMLEGRALDAALVTYADRFLALERRLLELGMRSPGTDVFGRELRTVLRMRGGVPFWDREPPEPRAPLSALEP